MFLDEEKESPKRDAWSCKNVGRVSMTEHVASMKIPARGEWLRHL